MINDNNERPRFDSQTGLPIVYDDDPKQEVQVNQEVQANHEEQVNQEFQANQEDVDTSSAVTKESDNTMFGINNNPYESSYSHESAYTDKRAAKLAKKAARKASKNNGNKSLIHKVGKLAAASVMCGVIAGGTMYGVYYTGQTYFPISSSKADKIEIATVNNSGVNGTTSGIVAESGSAATMDVTAIAKAAMPTIVAISGTVTTTSSNYGFPFGGGSSEASTSGTGIIIGKSDTELLVVTNAHVVDGVDNLKVTFNDNEAVNASVKGSKSDKDIAVVAVKIADIKNSTINSIAIATLGDSDSVQIGESVIAIGNALGEGQSVTVGWVSAMNRSITVDNTNYTNLIMTDAAINPGNSGGALLNSSGQVIGINSAKYASAEVEGMGYAIPISSVKDIIDNLMTKQTRSKVADSQTGYLGITGKDISSSSTSGFGFPQGIQVVSVSSGSGADKAGLVQNDIIVTFDGDNVTSMAGLKSLLQYYAAGETVSVGYYHYENGNYILKQTNVTLTHLTN